MSCFIKRTQIIKEIQDDMDSIIDVVSTKMEEVQSKVTLQESELEKKLNQKYEELHQKLDSEITYRRAQEFGESKKRKNMESLEVANKKLKCENEELKKKLQQLQESVREPEESKQQEPCLTRSVTIYPHGMDMRAVPRPHWTFTMENLKLNSNVHNTDQSFRGLVAWKKNGNTEEMHDIINSVCLTPNLKREIEKSGKAVVVTVSVQKSNEESKKQGRRIVRFL
ncbi:MAG: hypothetical protein CMF52_05535 [Legionellales bacterium]|nr:hypothetical protein [Legionellales bacterium]|tara:strand:- start:1962 stop:2636 length:675 start_codon:yes stop_codon:yes gene_type:complete